MIAHPDSLWPSLVVLLAIHRVQSIQRDVFFFHAASVGIKGRGLLLFGEKGAGKSTLSVALGERGHAFLGDETAAVRLSDRMLLPLRQRVSVRPGPQAPGMTRALEEGSFPRVHLTDGTDRMRMSAAELFPDPAPVPVVAAVFLRSRSDATRVDPFTPTIGDLGLLAPYESASASADAPSVALRLLRLLGSLRCYLLFPGSVSHTVSAIEALMED